MRTDVLHAVRLARLDLTLMGRNTTVMVNVLLLPLLMAWMFTNAAAGQQVSGVDGSLFALTGAPGMMLGFAVFVNLVNSFTARREELVLKRLRGGQPSAAAVLGGSALGALALYLGQVAIIAVWANRSHGIVPVNVPLLVVAAVLGVALFCLLAAAFSGVTPNAELAQVTVLPLLLVMLLGAPIAFPAEALPGALGTISGLLPVTPIVEIMRTAFLGGDHVSGNGEALGTAAQWVEVLPSLGILVAWIAVAAVLARWLFRWEPRRG
ncbi:ABC-2 type transport system permease protein [Streptosporangium becharense]|uniref:ABC-2 type transport system permease protein n=1 Tax=Streptosporangium becharense TaxID=1816182 RepID=A0A7W9MFI7_9ACTN|nr:ABC transporter permease [Streptosporangium becharense]MBB2909943.1 ABC-2 type transport system permease protein [Streptosporangium becharense]MBB5819102.1 ABC-2 type transport system permease protein [Streptosporangium becharense]